MPVRFNYVRTHLESKLDIYKIIIIRYNILSLITLKQIKLHQTRLESHNLSFFRPMIYYWAISTFMASLSLKTEHITFFLFITNQLILLLFHHPQTYFYFLHTHQVTTSNIYTQPRQIKIIYTYYNPPEKWIQFNTNTVFLKTDVMKFAHDTHMSRNINISFTRVFIL